MRPYPGSENATGKLRQKKSATAGTKFTNPGNGLMEIPCTFKVLLIREIINEILDKEN